MSRRIGIAALVSFLLALAIHTDWHVARPEHHRLSLGLSWHWLLAMPVFAVVAWYVRRAWPERVGQASLWIIGAAVMLGGVIEPAWEYFVDDAPFDWAFGRARTLVLLSFLCTGVVTYMTVLVLSRRRRTSIETTLP